MKTLLIAVLAIALLGAAAAQDSSSATPQGKVTKVTRKLKIRSADPALILLLLAGRTNSQTPPEISNSGRRGGI